MNRSMLTGAVLGGAAVLAFGAVAGYRAINETDTAKVLSAVAVTEQVRTPERDCGPVQVTQRRAPKDEHRIAGTVVGGVVGGLLGHQVGEGRGKDLATIAGVAAGGYAGNQVQRTMQDADKVTVTETRCRTVSRVSEKVVGYDVTYSLEGATGTVRMKERPGAFLPVRNGLVVVDATGASSKAN